MHPQALKKHKCICKIMLKTEVPLTVVRILKMHYVELPRDKWSEALLETQLTNVEEAHNLISESVQLRQQCRLKFVLIFFFFLKFAVDFWMLFCRPVLFKWFKNVTTSLLKLDKYQFVSRLSMQQLANWNDFL